jgi:hypothetical protein
MLSLLGLCNGIRNRTSGNHLQFSLYMGRSVTYRTEVQIKSKCRMSLMHRSSAPAPNDCGPPCYFVPCHKFALSAKPKSASAASLQLRFHYDLRAVSEYNDQIKHRASLIYVYVFTRRKIYIVTSFVRVGLRKGTNIEAVIKLTPRRTDREDSKH